MTICHEQLPPRTPININCLICGRGTIAAETHGDRIISLEWVVFFHPNILLGLTLSTLQLAGLYIRA